MEAKFTKGPWRWEVNLKHKDVVLCGGVPKFDSDVLRFERYGMQNAQPTFADNELGLQGLKSSDLSVVVEGREHHEDWFRGLNHPDAHLIAAAPEMYEMLDKLSTELLHMIRAENARLLQNIQADDLDPPDYLDEESVYLAQKLLAKARGEQ